MTLKEGTRVYYDENPGTVVLAFTSLMRLGGPDSPLKARKRATVEWDNGTVSTCDASDLMETP